MPDEPCATAACDVTVKYQSESGEWRAEGTCGWVGSYVPDSPEGRASATREGARHLFNVHGSYAGGHKPTMTAMGASDGE